MITRETRHKFEDVVSKTSEEYSRYYDEGCIIFYCCWGEKLKASLREVSREVVTSCNILLLAIKLQLHAESHTYIKLSHRCPPFVASNRLY